MRDLQEWRGWDIRPVVFQATLSSANAAKGRSCRVQENRFIGSLTGLRYVAAVTVAVGHGSLALRHDWLAQLVAQISSIGMTLFFVLSGFVLWLNYAAGFRSKPPSVALREFAIARFARLYPMYGIVVFAVVGWLVFRRGDAAPSLGFILTMTQAWFPVLDGTMLAAVVPSLQHLWSISVELFFYLLFPLVCFLLNGVARVRTVMVLAAINLGIFAISIWVFFQYGADFVQAFVPSLTEIRCSGSPTMRHICISRSFWPAVWSRWST